MCPRRRDERNEVAQTVGKVGDRARSKGLIRSDKDCSFFVSHSCKRLFFAFEALITQLCFLSSVSFIYRYRRSMYNIVKCVAIRTINMLDEQHEEENRNII